MAEASPIIDRLQASFDWIAASSLFRHPTELAAYRHTLALSQISVARGRSLETQLSHLVGVKVAGRRDDSAVDAAACAIGHDRPELAVELLELGRATLFAQLSRYRIPLDDLKQIDAKLADDFIRLSWLLEISAFSDRRIPVDRIPVNRFEDHVAR